ncbi:MAG: hypothetical protein R2911_44115 [Caldilineaceae bacterium]
MILAFSAGIATWRYRRQQISAGGNVRLTVTLLVLAVLSAPCVVFLAASFRFAGA